jgi:hypothetical protein
MSKNSIKKSVVSAPVVQKPKAISPADVTDLAEKRKAAPALPAKPEKGDPTDPKTRLTREEVKALTPEQRKARRQARMAKRGPIKARFEKQVLSMERRLKRVIRLVGTDLDEDAGKEALLALGTIAKTIRGLDENWKPSGSRGSAEEIAVGGSVGIRTKRIAEYADFFEDIDSDATGTFTVTRVSEKMVFVAIGKSTIPLPRNHVRAV